MPFKIVFLGGKQVGVIGLLTTLAVGCEVKAVVPRDSIVEELARKLGIPIYDSVKGSEIRPLLSKVDLMISVHSKEIVPPKILAIPRLGGINVHPCLYRYKGSYPIQKFLLDTVPNASVGVHRMIEEVDCGEVLVERFIEVDRMSAPAVIDIYNILYPLYSLVLIEALEMLGNE